MKSFDMEIVEKTQFHPSTTWLISQCTEARGLQKMWWGQLRPEVLRKLKESAIIQSVESSNRIEGVEVAKGRLHPLVLGDSKPKDRPEEEIQGYKKALAFIFENYENLEINPNIIKKLHKLAQRWNDF